MGGSIVPAHCFSQKCAQCEEAASCLCCVEGSPGKVKEPPYVLPQRRSHAWEVLSTVPGTRVTSSQPVVLADAKETGLEELSPRAQVPENQES
ncbi:hypothetical protein CapIbe_022551 [Capra ibex]